MPIVSLADRGFGFIPGALQYSAGVVAAPGHHLVRLTFQRLLPLAGGWRAVSAWLADAGLPLTAICACELRSPAPFTEDGFRTFNAAYAGMLRASGIFTAEGANPVARSNVCPAVDPPAEPGIYAVVVCAPGDGGGFVVSGSAETPGSVGNYSDGVVARGDTSPTGMRAKCDFVLGEMARRMTLLGATWREATAVQVYSTHELAPLMRDLIAPRGAAQRGVCWHFASPPVVGLEFEMDVRAVAVERVLAV